jgi:hypothetical protein
MMTHSVRGDALLASVRRGGGSYKGPWYNVYTLAAGAVICEALLHGIVTLQGGRLVPGPHGGVGALGQLAELVREEPRPLAIKEWLERTGPWARQAIEAELAEAGLAEGRVIRILLGTDERLKILNQAAQVQVFAKVHDVASGKRAATVEDALLVLLLGSAAMLQYHVRTMRGRRPRRIVRTLTDVLPRDVEEARSVYARWDIAPPS